MSSRTSLQEWAYCWKSCYTGFQHRKMSWSSDIVFALHRVQTMARRLLLLESYRKSLCICEIHLIKLIYSSKTRTNFSLYKNNRIISAYLNTFFFLKEDFRYKNINLIKEYFRKTYCVFLRSGATFWVLWFLPTFDMLFFFFCYCSFVIQYWINKNVHIFSSILIQKDENC